MHAQTYTYLFLVSLLVLALLVIFCSSAFLTLTGVSIYTLSRLYNLLQGHGRAGISLWMTEMKNAILNTRLIPVQEYSSKAEETELSDAEDAVAETEVDIKHEEDDYSDTLLSGSSTQEESFPSDEDVKPPT